MIESDKIRVLVAGEARVRSLVRQGLGASDRISVIATAADTMSGERLVLQTAPDVVVIQMDAPRVDAQAFLRVIAAARCGIVAIHGAPCRAGEWMTSLGAAGVQDLLELTGTHPVSADVARRLVDSVQRAAKEERIARWKMAVERAARRDAVVTGEENRRILAVGASTGGTSALAELFANLPASTPGAVVVQHMPKSFTTAFARRLNSLSPLEVVEAREGDPVRPGTVLLSPGGQHMIIVRSGPGYVVRLHEGPPVLHQRPSVDVLFRSVAACAGACAVGVLLTGMGADGAAGLLEILRRGGRTIAQDQSTSVVFGMPKEAIRMGAAERVLPLPLIAPSVSRLFQTTDRSCA